VSAGDAMEKTAQSVMAKDALGIRLILFVS
jgi:hypothetical protein